MNEAIKRDGVNVSDSKFKCDLCERSYNLKKDLNKHRKMKHYEEWYWEHCIKVESENSGQFKCEVCLASFLTS